MVRDGAASKYRRPLLAALTVIAVAVAAVVAWTQLGEGGDGAGNGSPADSGGATEASAVGENGGTGSDPVAADEQPPVRLTISVSGDILIHSPLYRRALANGGGKSYDFAPMFAQIRHYVARPDLAVCHLETPLTKDAPQGFPIFATPAKLADAIAETGWDACTTASNHSLDQGLGGIRTTEKALREAGVGHIGSASSPSRQARPLILEVHGVNVGVLGYTTMTNGIPLPAPWAVDIASPERILADARRLRRRGADAVLVNVHWGDEDSSETNAEQQRISEAVTKTRAVTALVGQGPHVVQPISRVNGRPVVFSEGNLLSNQTPSCCAAGSQDGLIAILEVTVDGERDRLTEVRYIPTWVRHPDYVVLPVGRASRSGETDRATLAASYERTVAVAGRAKAVHPVPQKRP